MQPNKPQQKPQQQYNCNHHCEKKLYNVSNYHHQTIMNPCSHLYQEAAQMALMSRKQIQLQQQQKQQLQLQQQQQQQQYIQQQKQLQQKQKEKQSCNCHPLNQYQQVVHDYLPCHPNSAFQPVASSSHHHHQPHNNKSCAYYDCQQVAYNKQCPDQHMQQHNTIYNTAKAHYQQYQPVLDPQQQNKQKLQYQQKLQQYTSAQQQSLLQQHQQQHQQQQLLYQMMQKNQHSQKKNKVYCSCHEKAAKHQLQNQLSLQNTQHYQQMMQHQQQVLYPYLHPQNHHQLYQMRSEEGDKIKRSRDQWDYELSQDLQDKKLEMLKRKYGGAARASRAARVIQQAYRRYSLDKNFAKLRSEVDRSRLSRRFNEAGRSNTIWTEGLQNANQYCEYPSGDGRQNNQACGNDARYNVNDNYAVRVSQKMQALSITTTISEERTIRKEEKTFTIPPQISTISESSENQDGFVVKDEGKDFQNLPLPQPPLIPEHSVGLPENNHELPSNNYYLPHCHNYFNDNHYDNNAEFDCDMVAELPTYDETTDDDIAFEHSYVYSDLGSDGSNKADDTASSSNPDYPLIQQQSQIRTQKPPTDVGVQQGNMYQGGFKGYGSLKKGEVVDLTEVDRKMFNSPVWKRKMEGDAVMFREVEQHLIARKATNHFTPPSQPTYHTPQASNSHHHPHNRPDVTQYSKGHNYNNTKPRVSNDKQRKRTYRIGLNLFNKKPEKGICYLIERNFLDNRPSAVARFLIARKGLSKQMIGEYLGNLQKQFNMEVLRCFVEEIDLSGMHIDQALRKFQSFFRMPGEAQKIERLMEAFSSQYCHWNPEVVKTFKRPDVVFLLAFAAIMLNTDLHNKSIKPDRKMKLEDFIKNLRGIDDGEDVKTDTLTTMYDRIKESEFLPGTDHVSQVAKVEQMIVGRKPQLAELHRRLVCYCRLYEVTDPSKKEKLGLHQREVFLFNDMIMVTKIIGRKRGSIQYSFRCTFSLSAMVVYLFESQHYKYGIKLTNDNNGKASIMLNARNEHDRTKFVEDLKEAILEMNEMEALRIEEELMKQQLMKQKHCNYNRHSKDSGVVDIELIRPSDFGSNRLSTANEAPARVSSSPSLPDVVEYVHRGSAGSLDSGLVNMHA